MDKRIDKTGRDVTDLPGLWDESDTVYRSSTLNFHLEEDDCAVCRFIGGSRREKDLLETIRILDSNLAGSEAAERTLQRTLVTLAEENLQLRKSIEDIKTVMRMSIHNVNFMRERRKEAFQMQGRYDVPMSDGCRKLFELEYKVFNELIGEHDDSEEE